MNYTDSNFFHNTPENKPPILIAEDDLTSRIILAGILRKWGYDPIAVNDGQAAWEVLQRSDAPGLVILDWMMPKMDGLQVIQHVRARVSEQPPYIILLTSKDEKNDILSGLESGANDYIKKPFEHEELLARIRVGQRTLELQTSLYEAKRSMEHLATRDPLTGILNRRAIFEQLSKELSRIQRGHLDLDGKKLSIGFFDVDKFKHINDKYGHQAGDDVLRGIAQILRTQVRGYDSISRLGGDEFLVLVPESDEAGYKKLYERLVSIIAVSPLLTCAGEVMLTISMGVATATPDISEDQLLNNADAAMYMAKRSGGNRVVYA
jgi:two-component system cell cycle response regulator